MDTSIPVENPDLVEKINRYVNSQSEADESQLKEALLKAKLLAPASVENWKEHSQGKQVLDHDIHFHLMGIQDKENNIYLPAFTDWNEITKWRNDAELKAIVLTLADYVKVLMKNNNIIGLVINPYGENLVLHKQQIEEITNQSKLRSGEKIKIGIPENYPTDLCEALKEYFRTSKCVSEAYLLLMVRKNNKQSYLLVLETNEDTDILYPKLAKIVSQYLARDEVIDFVSSKEKFGKSVIEGQTPFYQMD